METNIDLIVVTPIGTNKVDLPKWLIDICGSHKSNWKANSKGGEPNCKK